MSAIDLAGVSLLALGVVAAGHVPGASSFAPVPAAGGTAAMSPWWSPVVSPGLFFGLATVESAPTIHSFIILAASATVVATRVRIARESPPSLILVNVLWYVVLLADYALVRGHASQAPWLVAVFLVVGAGLYGAKWPERSLPGIFDLVGHSHSIWHILYISALAVYGVDVLLLARDAAVLAAATTSAV